MFKRYFVISDRPLALKQAVKPKFSFHSQFPENHDEGFSVLEEARTFKEALLSTLKDNYPENTIAVEIWDNIDKKLVS